MTEMTSVEADLLDCECEPCIKDLEHLGRS